MSLWAVSHGLVGFVQSAMVGRPFGTGILIETDISTRLGRLLLMLWFMIVLLFTASYTASLASILSSQLHIPKFETFQEVQKNPNSLIGYQDGSFTKSYITDSLHIKSERLRKLVTEVDYEKSLESRQVDAILDELPYVQAFLNSKCKYTKISQQIAYFGGLGFAFQKDSSLTEELSLEILKLEQNNKLQDLREKFLGINNCGVTNTAGTNIPLEYFGGLFIILLSIYATCILLRLLGWFCECLEGYVNATALVAI
ncbi:hypothetical protein L7F22_012584 [Adiantum nelumboides]|nr:hypothetical protein [Adiantum nelumboides]